LVDDVDQHIKNTKENWLKNVDPKLQSFWKRYGIIDGVPMQQKPFRKVSKILDESVLN
jgi:hypothetical protein